LPEKDVLRRNVIVILEATFFASSSAHPAAAHADQIVPLTDSAGGSSVRPHALRFIFLFPLYKGASSAFSFPLNFLAMFSRFLLKYSYPPSPAMSSGYVVWPLEQLSHLALIL
jgi:hypothetical protein